MVKHTQTIRGHFALLCCSDYILYHYIIFCVAYQEIWKYISALKNSFREVNLVIFKKYG